jgi:tripartite-type tricarboxylate transporter receptor subunit TctC
MFGGTLSVAPHVKAGRLRALAVTSLKRRPETPEQPTVSETIVPGFEAVEWFGVIGPARLPKPLLARLHAELLQAVNHPEMKERILADGMDILTGTPDEFAAHIRQELAKWRKVVKQSGITAE